MKRTVPAMPLLLPLLLAIAGCGSSDASPAVDESDLPGTALACIQSEGIEAERRGDDGDEIVLSTGERIRFHITADAAIAAQFGGDTEGAEQIGSALLFVTGKRDGETEDRLRDVEGCLADL